MIVNKKFKIFNFQMEQYTMLQLMVNGAVWSNPLIFLTH